MTVILLIDLKLLKLGMKLILFGMFRVVFLPGHGIFFEFIEKLY